MITWVKFESNCPNLAPSAPILYLYKSKLREKRWVKFERDCPSYFAPTAQNTIVI